MRNNAKNTLQASAHDDAASDHAAPFSPPPQSLSYALYRAEMLGSYFLFNSVPRHAWQLSSQCCAWFRRLVHTVARSYIPAHKDFLQVHTTECSRSACKSNTQQKIKL